MFKLSQKSKDRLVGIDDKLIILVNTAITNSTIDFGVTEALRTLERQKYLKSIGASTTLDSKHLTGQAIDLVAYVDGTIRWEWPLYYRLAEHIRKVAKELNIRLRWGGAWDVYSFTHTVIPTEELVINYVERQRANGKKAFIDGPHFELCTRSEKN